MSTTITAPKSASTWTIDPAHAEVGFEVKHMMFATVRGRFTDVEGTLSIGSKDEDSKASVVIRAASIDTGQGQRDDHLRSSDFLDVDRFPVLTFESASLRRDGDRLVLSGELSIRDVARRVDLEVEESGRGIDPWGNERVGFTARAMIDRRDYGLAWNQALETGGILVGNDVRIVIDVQAVRAES